MGEMGAIEMLHEVVLDLIVVGLTRKARVLLATFRTCS